MRREADDGFELSPADFSEVLDFVHQNTLSMRYFNGAGNLTDVQLRTDLEKVARVKRLAEETGVSKIRNDITRGFTMGDKMALYDSAAMVTGNLSHTSRRKLSGIYCVRWRLGKRALTRW